MAGVKPLEISGISYYEPPAGAVLLARDGKVNFPYGELPVPLLNDDFTTLAGGEPSYDMVGRGVYHALRANPDAPFSAEYAALLKSAYPHLLAELATHLVMLDKKDVDLPYLDRKINYLKVFALLEPENHRFPLEIGATLLEKGLSLGALNHTTVLLYRAEKYTASAVTMKPDDVQAKHQLAEISYLLGRYEVAVSLWSELATELPDEVSAATSERLRLIRSGQLPAAPAVDYLQAIGVAMEAFVRADYEEAAAIILDAMEALAFFEEFPLAEINYILGLCYSRMDIPLYAEQYLRQALQLKPDYEEAKQELNILLGG